MRGVYRDRSVAVRAEIEARRASVERLEARMAPALTGRLPLKLRALLMASRKRLADAEQAARAASDAEILVALGAALEHRADALERALAAAPRIERDYNRLPRTFPPAAPEIATYLLPDIFDEATQAVRERAHAAVLRIDADARLRDRRPGYFDRLEQPYLVDAELRHEGTPLRFVVGGFPVMRDPRGLVLPFVVPHAASALLRPSAPVVRVWPAKLLDRALRGLGMQRDVRIGRASFDDLFIVDGDPERAAEALAPVAETLLELGSHAPELDVRSGLAQIRWREREQAATALSLAAGVLAALRALPPLPLTRASALTRAPRPR
jgi:hypothetical protein